ncbi:MAG: hypothetical protein JWM09_231 [Francisellaceae bacterium]|nr:hypothetical protein [Francisellaceae bacterium]
MFCIEKILFPININGGVGEDPKYLDKYIYLINEVKKSEKNNFDEIINLTTLLLEKSTKDLRVLNFLFFGLVAKKNINHIIYMLETFNKLLNKFGPNLHPTTSDLQISACEWLNNSRFIALFKQAINNVEISNLNNLLTKLSTLEYTMRNNLSMPNFNLKILHILRANLYSSFF